MKKIICDICGKVIDEDYTRHHYSYDLDFVGKIPHQTTRDNGVAYSTLVYYPDPGEVHFNLCGECGSDIKKSLNESIEKLKKKKGPLDKEVISQIIEDAMNDEDGGKDPTLQYLMDIEEWKKRYTR